MKVETLLAVIRFWLLLILIVMIVLLAVMKQRSQQNDSAADTGSDRSQVIKIQQKYTTNLMYSTTNDVITTGTTEETVTNYVDETCENKIPFFNKNIYTAGDDDIDPSKRKHKICVVHIPILQNNGCALCKYFT